MTIDYWKLTREFTQGDAVQKIDVVTGDLSPYVGSVTAVHRGLGVLDVQWPFGNERVFPDDVVLVNPQVMRYLPPTYDQSYSSYDISEARKRASEDTLWQHRVLPAQLYVDLAQSWHKGASEVVAYDDLYRKYEATVEDEALRAEVDKFYRFARNAGELRIQAYAEKHAAYWFAQNRQYRATADEIRAGCPGCPRCATRMRKSTYRMQEGAKHKVFACPSCLYLIDPGSILAPSGEPHDWFGGR